jgi:hypothetical protein
MSITLRIYDHLEPKQCHTHYNPISSRISNLRDGDDLTGSILENDDVARDDFVGVVIRNVSLIEGVRPVASKA